jgi:outer membrane protein OmpA-like peptidoglycan-associated protein
MKTYKQGLALLILIGSFSLFAQETTPLTSKDSIVQSSWVLGIGMNIVDDSATPFGRDFLKMKQTWNVAPYPSRLSIGRFFKNGIGVEAIGSYNSYKEGKKVDGVINPARRTYYAFDGKISYDLNQLIGETAWFDPYLHIGAGYSSIGSLGRATANAGFGFNTWFNDRWGLNFNTMGKWGIKEGSTKQLQHSAGVVYRFATEKGLTEKGAEKLAMLEALRQKEDSLLAVKQAQEEANALAEQLAREQEAARLAKLSEEKVQAVTERERLQQALDSLGAVYFDFDSSYLNEPAKKVLQEITVLMEANPAYHFQVAAYADSRGPSKYNLLLSQKRSQRVVDYLVTQGLASARLEAIGYGESKLVNECSDGVYCTEEKHAQNRRADIALIVTIRVAKN